MRVKTGDFVMALVLLAVTAALYHQSTTINTAMIYALGPVFFPRIIMAFTALLSVILMVQSVSFKPAAAGKRAKTAFDREGFIYRWGLFALLVAYLLALSWFGYLAATIPFLFAGMVLLGPRTPKDLALYGAVALGVTFGLQFIFATLLKLFLP
jgi:hypothetical protein